VNEIWNIATNHLRSCGFAPYIQYMIEMVTKEKFYKDSRHDPLCPAVSKDWRAYRASSSAAPTAAPVTPCVSNLYDYVNHVFERP
jgi:hypothetical protein